jgi:D-lactate dehydrogenase
MQQVYSQLAARLRRLIPESRLVDDPLRTFAYGTDASFYRLNPGLVVKVVDEEEVRLVLELANRFQVPVTFRAAGTSLSGQAITDALLMVLSGEGWRDYSISEDGSEISLQPGIIGAVANEYLAPFRRKIGPDPASINAAKIGGIAANNASGMCCGTAQNSYNTLLGMRLVLVDGAVLDSRDPNSVEAFRNTHGDLLEQLEGLSQQTRANGELAQRIRHKYRLKNTTGYSLNALVDFDDPVDILQHLMIGSEGTLGFISEISYRTVPDHPCKATALVLFPSIEIACQAVTLLKETPVTAVELMDRAALRSVEERPDMPDFLQALDDEVSALLIDARAEDLPSLQADVESILDSLRGLELARPAAFTFDEGEYQALWNIRKGLFPAVGAVRPVGTTVIIEDIAFPVPELAAAVRELQALFLKYRYHEALIFGHALEGNLHFVFTQDFSSAAEVERYQGLMEEVCKLVVGEYGGSLKAEHGTGRNMAPFVEMEWGSDAYRLMWELKRLFDPDLLLNPGVILNEDPEIHLKNLKPLPAADGIVDKCIECGFCEAICPSRELTLTPRQRIATWREISRLRVAGDEMIRLERLERDFEYQGLDTCAVDGLCAIRCPVGIDTGRLVRKVRSQRHGPAAERVADWVSDNFSRVEGLTRGGLKMAGWAQGLLGNDRMQWLSRGMRSLSGNRLPLWNPGMPGAAEAPVCTHANQEPVNGRVVYFPSCVSRTMGSARGDPQQDDLHRRMQSLLVKAGFEAILPEPVKGLCCGMSFDSKGLPEQAAESIERLEEALWQASQGGEYPVLCDTSPCTMRMIERFSRPLRVFEPVGFITEYLLPFLSPVEPLDSVALHITCSSRKMGLEQKMLGLAGRCARRVVVSEEKGCCGFAGDKGFTRPELNASALGSLRASLPEGVSLGFSNSRTCEIGLSNHSGIPYQSIVYLVDQTHEGTGKGR